MFIAGIIFLCFNQNRYMKRDGATNSLWQMGMEDYQAAANPGNIQFDVIIAGGGVTGVTTALQLQKAGMKCLLLEAQTLCFGTTGGTTAHLNTFLDTSYHDIKSDFGEDAIHLVSNATTRALDLYLANIEEYNIDCEYEQKDGYVYSVNDKQTEELDKIFNASRLAGVDVAYSDRIPLDIKFQKAIVYRNQAQVHATKYVFALAKEFEKAGGVILQHCRVEKTVEADDKVTVESSLGAFQGTFLIYATHIPPHINLLHFRCAPYRSYAIAVKLNGNYPEGLSYDMFDPYHYYRTQEVNGEKYFIIGGEDHKTAHETNTEACFRNLEAHAREHFDVQEITHKWSSQFFEPSDGLAYIGLLPGSSGNILVATGYSGNGMTYSHIAALLLTDLVHKKENAWAALFNPNRIKPVAGFANFVKENADVVKQFIGKRISTEKIKELSEMAAGEGKLVKFEGNRLAIYKDESGKIYALNPVCTHAKCIVDWNQAEKSWDCPCHGARYDIDGTVLTGPASHALELVELSELVNKGDA
jgi:glycine/D-amino acid oxidase-like deaminating enzyme/nitrite reductase/ring-hydroxylating ferredoxin subunit